MGPTIDTSVNPGSRAHRSAQRGFALIAVLWGIALLAVIAASVTVTSRTEIRLAQNSVDAAKGRVLAEAAVARAALGLLHVDPSRRLAVDGTAYLFRFADGEVRIMLEDEGGKIDLNRAPESLLAALFRELDVEQGEALALADAIADFRDPNDARRINGAEDEDYRAAGRRLGAKDLPFEDVNELRGVLGMSPELFERAASALTVYSGRRRVNPATASPLVLRALPGLDAAELESRLAENEDQPEEVALGDGGDDEPPPEETSEGDGMTRLRAAVARTRTGAVTVRAEARLDSGATFVRETVMRVGRSRTRPYIVLALRQGRMSGAEQRAP